MPGTHRVGGGLTPPVPPHHRTYGSVSGGSPQYRSARYLPVRLTSPCSLNHWLLMASFACGLPAIRHQPDDRSRPACAPAQCRGAGVIPALSGCLRRTGRPGEVVGPRRSGREPGQLRRWPLRQHVPRPHGRRDGRGRDVLQRRRSSGCWRGCGGWRHGMGCTRSRRRFSSLRR